MTALAALMLAAAPTVGASAFHPVEGVAYVADTVVTRVDDGVTRRFHTARTLVFRREGDGYLVEAVLQKPDQEAPGTGAIFTKSIDALTGRTIRYHLDANGAVTAVDDADLLIELIAAQVEKAGAGRPGGAMFASPLRAAGPEQRRALLASFIAPLIVTGDARRPDGQRAVTLPAQPPMPAGAGLPGEETVKHDAQGIVSVETRASGTITGPADLPGGSTTAGSVTVSIARHVDPKTGLLVDSRSDTTIVTGKPGASHTGKTETVLTLRKAISDKVF